MAVAICLNISFQEQYRTVPEFIVNTVANSLVLQYNGEKYDKLSL